MQTFRKQSLIARHHTQLHVAELLVKVTSLDYHLSFRRGAQILLRLFGTIELFLRILFYKLVSHLGELVLQ